MRGQLVQPRPAVGDSLTVSIDIFPIAVHTCGSRAISYAATTAARPARRSRRASASAWASAARASSARVSRRLRTVIAPVGTAGGRWCVDRRDMPLNVPTDRPQRYLRRDGNHHGAPTAAHRCRGGRRIPHDPGGDHGDDGNLRGNAEPLQRGPVQQHRCPTTVTSSVTVTVTAVDITTSCPDGGRSASASMNARSLRISVTTAVIVTSVPGRSCRGTGDDPARSGDA